MSAHYFCEDCNRNVLEGVDEHALWCPTRPAPPVFTARDVDALRDAICPLGTHADYDYEELADRLERLLAQPR